MRLVRVPAGLFTWIFPTRAQYTIRTYNQNGTTPSLSLNIGGPGSIVQDQWVPFGRRGRGNGVTATNVYAYIDGALVTGSNSFCPASCPTMASPPPPRHWRTIRDNSFQFDGNIGRSGLL